MFLSYSGVYNLIFVLACTHTHMHTHTRTFEIQY